MTKTTRWPCLEIEDTAFDVIVSFKSVHLNISSSVQPVNTVCSRAPKHRSILTHRQSLSNTHIKALPYPTPILIYPLLAYSPDYSFSFQWSLYPLRKWVMVRLVYSGWSCESRSSRVDQNSRGIGCAKFTSVHSPGKSWITRQPGSSEGGSTKAALSHVRGALLFFQPPACAQAHTHTHTQQARAQKQSRSGVCVCAAEDFAGLAASARW